MYQESNRRRSLESVWAAWLLMYMAELEKEKDLNLRLRCLKQLRVNIAHAEQVRSVSEFDLIASYWRNSTPTISLVRFLVVQGQRP